MDDSHYEVQKVEIRNNISLDEAKSKYKHITKRKAKKVRETKNFYQFRLTPPTKFVKGSFRAKKVNKDIVLIVGELKPEFQHLSGGGFGDYFKRAYSAVSGAVSSVGTKIVNAFTIHDYSTKTKKNLELYGNLPVIALEIRRKPLNIAIELAFQGVSAGQWEELKKKYGFDKFYHLSAVVTLLNEDKTTKLMAFEKLEVVSFNDNIGFKKDDGTERLSVPVPKPFTITDMFTKTRQTVGDDRFFSYSGIGGNNCQDFIAMCLTSEGLYGEKERAFTYQNMKALTDELPNRVKAIARGVTQIGAIANKFLGIGGSHEFLEGEYENEIPHTINSLHGGMKKKKRGGMREPDWISEINWMNDYNRQSERDNQSDHSRQTEVNNQIERDNRETEHDSENLLQDLLDRAQDLTDNLEDVTTRADKNRIKEEIDDIMHRIIQHPVLHKIMNRNSRYKGMFEDITGDGLEGDGIADIARKILNSVINSKIFHKAMGKLGSIGDSEQFYGESKPCWKGYEKKGTKMKNGKKVNNCVKTETQQFYEYVMAHKHDLESKHTLEQMLVDWKESKK